MTTSLERSDSRALVAGARRSYALAKTPEEVLELLARPGNPPVLSAEEAKRALGSEPFVVLEEDGSFTLYKPWRPLVTSGEGILTRDVRVGPALRGRLVRTARGARLDVTVRSFAPAPSQRRELAVAAIGLAIFAIAPLAIAGLHPLAIALSAFVIVGALAGVLLHGRRQRAADLRGLWAIVEGTFGPLELAAGGDAPRRREAPGDASDPTQTRSGSR